MKLWEGKNGWDYGKGRNEWIMGRLGMDGKGMDGCDYGKGRTGWDYGKGRSG